MSEQSPIRVMLVDDHLTVRDGLQVFLSVYDDLEIVAEAEDGAEAFDLCAQVRIDDTSTTASESLQAYPSASQLWISPGSMPSP